MAYITTTFLMFFLSLCAHIVVHKLLLYFRIITFKSAFVFLFGFLLTLYLLLVLYQHNQVNDLLFISIILYPVVSGFYLLVISTSYLGYTSLASTIVMLLQKEAMAEKKIIDNFSNTVEVMQRLDALILDGFIEKSGVKYKIKTKGRMFMSIVSFYRRLLHLDDTG